MADRRATKRLEMLHALLYEIELTEWLVRCDAGVAGPQDEPAPRTHTPESLALQAAALGAPGAPTWVRATRIADFFAAQNEADEAIDAELAGDVAAAYAATRAELLATTELRHPGIYT